MDLTPDQWKSTLGFVPTKEARSAATQNKVNFLVNVREGNSLVSFSSLQKVLLGEPNEVVYELNPSCVQWLARELGDQLLTLCLKESRQSVTTFVLYSLHTIDINTLLSISIKGKKARFRDWRDVIFTTVKQLPVVKYRNRLQFQLPEGYQLVTSNHEMLMAAEKFNNCAFELSAQKAIIEGNEFVLLAPEDGDVEPIMLHGVLNSSSHMRVKEVKHPDNKFVGAGEDNKLLNLLINLRHQWKNKMVYSALPVYSLDFPEEGYARAVDLPYKWVDHYEGGLITAMVVTKDAHGFMRAVDLPEEAYEYDPDAPWVDNVFDDED